MSGRGHVETLQPGGKSLSGDGTHSPVLNVRVSAQMHAQLHRMADERGCGVSKIVRRILEDALHAR